MGDECVIWGFSDINSERVIEVVNEYNIFYVFVDYKDMFKEVDVVCICILNKFYVEFVVEVLKVGVYVLCEKLMVMFKE